ncbi:hypothetical protein JQN72_12665 [Phycicoccus sp. CSK15P-2]|uniref:hypothetical protein n=1 Tax=Phycicoccus sp. CSK15P-2 TaxID=2807627 RepID=UPI0019507DCF|nr:hypothetical protein [Phycicoccus sp. CSK15P-2]MBM6403630.1 hypothetical protein [Phycicoccus sp. CSK15P-2]MBM6405095.1 hypothetical protein [Phycicoccus sp. CSK15P-2]
MQDGTNDGVGGVAERRASASYVSTREVIARESSVLVEDIEGAPGYWRRFTVHHVLVAAVFLALVVVLHALGRTDGLAGTVRGTTAFLGVFALLTGFDLWHAKRTLRRDMRQQVELRCSVGTLVSAEYTPERFTFVLPSHEVVVDPATVTRARYVRGVLLLDQAGAERAWAVPIELLGADGLALLRDTLGTRFVERLR